MTKEQIRETLSTMDERAIQSVAISGQKALSMAFGGTPEDWKMMQEEISRMYKENGFSFKGLPYWKLEDK